MDERAFIERKKQSWDEISAILDRAGSHGPGSLPPHDLESLGARYRTLASDLSYARSERASDELVLYLNELAGRAHGVLYAAPSARARGLRNFLFAEFPALFRAHWRYPLVAALVFFLGWAIAEYIVAYETPVAHQFVSQRFSGGSGDEGPVSVPDPARMSSFIMTNNVKVGIMSFAAGISAGVLTTYVLFSNGLLIGFVAAIRGRELGPTLFWSYILPHGVIELVAIFICGGAGLMIGAAIIAPGNLRRADAVRGAAGKALRLFAGTLPLFVIAGIIEGFITPSVLPAWSKLAFAAVTALALILYLGFSGRPRPFR